MSGSLWLTEREERELRATLRPQLAAAIPAAHVDLILDLSLHAARQAIETLDRTCQNYRDDRIYLASVAPAIGIAVGRLQQVEEAIKTYADKTPGVKRFEGRARL